MGPVIFLLFCTYESLKASDVTPNISSPSDMVFIDEVIQLNALMAPMYELFLEL